MRKLGLLWLLWCGTALAQPIPPPGVSAAGPTTYFGTLSAAPAGASAPAGGGVTTLDMLQNGVNVNLARLTGTSLQPAFQTIFSNASSQYVPYGYGSGPTLPAIYGEATSVAGSTGQVAGVWANLISKGGNASTSQDQALVATVTKLGQNSTWAIATQSQDNTGLIPGAFATWGIENDLVTNGPDVAACAYNPKLCSRVMHWMAAKTNPVTAYASNAAFAKGTLISETPPAGVPTIFIAQNAGTTGGSPPTWNGTYGATVTDGTITWLTGTITATQTGTGLEFVTDFTSNFNTIIGVNAGVTNAVIDTSFATLTQSGSAAIRMAPTQPIDFTGNQTMAGWNQHILEYTNNSPAGLAYIINGTTVTWEATNAGDFQINGLGLFNQGAEGNLSGRATGYNNTGLTLGRNLTTFGETDFVTGQHGAAFFNTDGSGNVTSSTPYLTASVTGLSTIGTLTSNGTSNLNATTPLGLSATAGFLQAPTTAGIPTGAPAGTNNCAIDTANGVLNCYYGAAWHHLTFSAGAG